MRSTNKTVNQDNVYYSDLIVSFVTVHLLSDHLEAAIKTVSIVLSLGDHHEEREMTELWRR